MIVRTLLANRHGLRIEDGEPDFLRKRKIIHGLADLGVWRRRFRIGWELLLCLGNHPAHFTRMLAIEGHFQSLLNTLCLGIGHQHLHPGDPLQHPQRTTAEMQASGEDEEKFEVTFQTQSG